MTEAGIGHGTYLFLARPAAPTTWIQIAEITDVTPPGLSRDAIDATHMSSPEKWREFIKGLKDGGEASVDMNLKPGSASELLFIESIDDDENWPMKIVLPNTARWEATTITTGYEPAVPNEDKMTASATLKVSGKPNLYEPA